MIFLILFLELFLLQIWVAIFIEEFVYFGETGDEHWEHVLNCILSNISCLNHFVVAVIIRFNSMQEKKVDVLVLFILFWYSWLHTLQRPSVVRPGLSNNAVWALYLWQEEGISFANLSLYMGYKTDAYWWLRLEIKYMRLSLSFQVLVSLKCILVYWQILIICSCT